MKALVFIWTVAIITGVIAVNYVNAGISELVVKPVQAAGYTYDAVQRTATPQLTAQTSNTFDPQQDQIGGIGQDNELQPALGYGELGRTLQ